MSGLDQYRTDARAVSFREASKDKAQTILNARMLEERQRTQRQKKGKRRLWLGRNGQTDSRFGAKHPGP